MDIEENNVERSLQASAEMVKALGSVKPDNKPTIRQLLTVQGVSIWDAMAVELALYHLPSALAPRLGRRTFKELVTPILRPLKYKLQRAPRKNDLDCPNWPKDRPAILFLGFTWYLARDILVPIAAKVQERGVAPILLTIGKRPSGLSEGSAHSIERHITKGSAELAQQYFGEIKSRANTLLTDSHYASKIHEKISVPPNALQGALQTVFLYRAAFQLRHVWAAAFHAIEFHKPSLIVSADVADPRTRIFSQVGRTKGIPTIQVQSGQVASESVEWRFFEDEALAAEGISAKKMYQAHGVNPERIIVAGSPRYDGMVPSTEEEKLQVYRRFLIPEDHRLIVLASAYFVDYGGAKKTREMADTGRVLTEMKRAIFRAKAKFPKIALIVKPHPLENIDETRSLVQGDALIHFARNDEKISPLIKACDVFISFGSATTMDAIFVGKPTVCPVFPGWLFSTPFANSGAVVVPQSPEELERLFAEIAEDGGRGISRRHESQRLQYLQQMVHTEATSAAERLAGLAISKMISHPVSGHAA